MALLHVGGEDREASYIDTLTGVDKKGVRGIGKEWATSLHVRSGDVTFHLGLQLNQGDADFDGIYAVILEAWCRC